MDDKHSNGRVIANKRRCRSALARIDAFLEHHEESYAELTRLLYLAMFGEELEKSGPVKLPQVTTNGHE